MVWIVLAIIVIIAALYKFVKVFWDICERGEAAMAKLEKRDRLYAQIDPKYYGGSYDYYYTPRRKQNSDDSCRLIEQQVLTEQNRQVEEAARLASTGFEFGGWDTSPAQNPSQMNMNNNGFGF